MAMWLKYIFGVAFLGPHEVEDAFVQDCMSIAPNDKRCTQFADYLTRQTLPWNQNLPKFCG